MSDLIAFTDASFNPQRRLGVGAYLILPRSILLEQARIDHEVLTSQISTKKFTETTTARLELETALWALENLKSESIEVTVNLYTDSQTLTGLNDRRKQLEERSFRSRKSGDLLSNADLYQKFYELHDQLGFEVIKVQGHAPTGSRDVIHRIFALVDQHSRRVLREWVKGYG
ncbi:MAG: RNase H family protein [Bacteroidota bacterium]